MESSRWFTSRILLHACIAGWLCGIQLEVVRADTAGHMDVDIHDGVPFFPISFVGTGAVGNFMTGIDTWGTGFMLERVWFYHGGNYAESGVPYRIHLVQRWRVGESESFQLLGYFDRQTTCNDCWENTPAVIYQDYIGSDEDCTFGVFIQPLGDGVGSVPRLWRDHYTDHEHSSAVLGVYWHLGPSPASRPGDRDLYGVDYYFSDYGLGEVLLGMEISSDVIVATAPTSFSAVKSLY